MINENDVIEIKDTQNIEVKVNHDDIVFINNYKEKIRRIRELRGVLLEDYQNRDEQLKMEVEKLIGELNNFIYTQLNEKYKLHECYNWNLSTSEEKFIGELKDGVYKKGN